MSDLRRLSAGHPTSVQGEQGQIRAPNGRQPAENALSCHDGYYKGDPGRVMLQSGRQTLCPSAALCNDRSVRTINGVYTKFGIALFPIIMVLPVPHIST